ncbi:potassium channel family protein [Glycomyces sp. TRM65418]|uniref:potassium channel family protein n=1 Tax=Glycomyces sp. TRM65418 TaxID=2867006 RepID=UPI001CE68E01|nr:potassium channel family protein [Glycomyces sp. TRM65418]MCC3762444.1 potassium channel family protein [Glycomyces sp. TRM65418]QZD56488.1 potassium channel family protein [Glycomyces sp. TRM65418]
MITVQILGFALIVLAAWDAAVTVLHPDREGLLATAIRRTVWAATTLLSARLGASVLGLAGPVIVACTFLGWILLATLGMAVAAWPILDTDFSIQTALGTPTFVDALYFAAGTTSVLGYGDVTPLSTQAQLLAVFGAGVGFTMFTGMATYVIQVVNGVATRNRFTLALHDDARGDGGVTMLADCLVEAGVEETRGRCRNWAEHLRAVDEMVHRYPLVAFTYRSRRPEYDPEAALRHVAEATVTALVAAAYTPGLRTAAETLCSALTRLQATIAETYLSEAITRGLTDPEPTERDRAAVAAVDRALSGALGPAESPTEHRRAAEAVCRTRIFLEGLHHWTRSEPPRHEWDA